MGVSALRSLLRNIVWNLSLATFIKLNMTPIVRNCMPNSKDNWHVSFEISIVKNFNIGFFDIGIIVVPLRGESFFPPSVRLEAIHDFHPEGK